MIRYDTQEALLLAYVDGHLTGAEAAEVEGMLASDPAMRQQIDQLRLSSLPFQEAFDAELDLEIPANLKNMIDQWPAAEMPVDTLSGQARQGLVGRVAVLMIGLLLGLSLATWSQHPKQDSAKAWLNQVASYHSLYVRATVEFTDFNAASKLRLEQTMRQSLRGEIPIPDLQAQQLDFKRGQLLQIEGSPLIQIAYLPEQGAPVVLCLTRRQTPDHDFRYGSSHDLRYVNWTRDGISYLLLGSLDFDHMSAIAHDAASQL